MNNDMTILLIRAHIYSIVDFSSLIISNSIPFLAQKENSFLYKSQTHVNTIFDPFSFFFFFDE